MEYSKRFINTNDFTFSFILQITPNFIFSNKYFLLELLHNKNNLMVTKIISFIPQELINNREFMINAILINEQLINYLPEYFKNDKNFMIDVIKNNVLNYTNKLIEEFDIIKNQKLNYINETNLSILI